jgi:hypothetical protein
MYYKNRILINIYILFLIFLSQNISYSQDTLQFYFNDTINIYINARIQDNQIEYKNYNDMELVEKEFDLLGYLILKFDSSVIYEHEYFIDHYYNVLRISAFWVETLDKIDIDSCHYYYYPYYWLMMEDGKMSYNIGNKDELSTFFFYLYYFNQYKETRKLDGINYLYSGMDKLRSDTLINCSFFTKGNSKNMYVIFDTHFNAAVLKFKSSGKKILIPTTSLFWFEPIKEDSYVLFKEREVDRKINNFGFKRIFPKIRILSE